MNVAELIIELKKYPIQTEVVTFDECGNMSEAYFDPIKTKKTLDGHGQKEKRLVLNFGCNGENGDDGNS